MTREELMINDIVFVYTNSPVKVCAIGQDIVVKGVFGVGALDPNELNPIPLTEEILVKNGWRKHIMLYKNEWYGDIGLFEEHGKFYYMDFKFEYVHQLQHALRLIGIEKEIKL